VKVESTRLPDVKLVQLQKHGDNRGFFVETWSQPKFHDIGIDLPFCQDNRSYSADAGVLRGLHLQTAPFAQSKLVLVLRGRIYDVAVDVRRDSPTFGQHVGVELTADGCRMLLVPRGFLHGFLTLESDTEVFYKVDAPYAPDHEGGVIWNDPTLAIDWPLPPGTTPTLSEKDSVLPRLEDARL